MVTFYHRKYNIASYRVQWQICFLLLVSAMALDLSLYIIIILLHTVGIILYYIVICLFITGSQATMLVVIVKTLVVLVW